MPVRLLCLLPLLVAMVSAQTLEVSVHVTDRAALARLQRLTVDLATCSCGGIHLPADVPVFLDDPDHVAGLRLAGFEPTIVHADAEAFYRGRLDVMPRPDGPPAFGQGSMGGYFTYAETVAHLDALQARFPAIMAPKVSLGTTLEGRDIWMWKISDSPLVDENEPEILIDALHHAREVGTIKSVVRLATRLCEGHGTDPELTALVDLREWYLVPMVNADGLVHNETTSPGGGGLWRKNRRPNGDGSFGVDLNRNYGYLWGFDNAGSSGTPGSGTYRGAVAFSEPATQVMKSFAEARQLRVYQTMHSYGRLVCLPPSHTTGAYPPAPLRARYERIGNEMQAMPAGYRAGPTWEVLYDINGSSYDWYYGSLYGGGQVIACMTEQGTSGDGFWPPTSRIAPLAEEASDYALYLGRIAGADPRVVALDVLDTGGATSGVWEPGETLGLAMTLENGGALSDLVSVEVVTNSPWLSVPSGVVVAGTIAEFGSLTVPTISLGLSASCPPGTPVAFTVRITTPSSGVIEQTVRRVVGAAPVTLVSEAFETGNGGWTVGSPGDNATAGVWTRQDPNGTTFQGGAFNPEDDATAAPGVACWFTGQGSPGGSVGAQDVDGITTLVSPVFDLMDVADPVVSYRRWFATSGTDTLTVELSNDGGATWTLVETVSGSAATWSEVSHALDAVLPRTSAMQLRFRAADNPNDSLCEAGIDDFRLDGRSPGLEIAATGSAAPGTRLDLTLHSPWWAGSTYLLGSALSSRSGIPVQAGLVPLDIDPLFLAVPGLPTVFEGFSGTLDATGGATAGIRVPNDPALSGLAFHTAGVVVAGGEIVAISGALRTVIP